MVSVIKCTSSRSLNCTSSFSIVSVRMKIFQPVTSYLSLLISKSQSCLKCSIMPPVLKKLLKKIMPLSFGTFGTCMTCSGPVTGASILHLPKIEKKHFTECFCPFIVSFEMYFNLQLLEAFSHFMFLFWVNLPWIIFLKQIVYCHSKKMHLSSLVHETHVLRATMTDFLWAWEHCST